MMLFNIKLIYKQVYFKITASSGESGRKAVGFLRDPGANGFYLCSTGFGGVPSDTVSTS
jgi:hypothetical protein